MPAQQQLKRSDPLSVLHLTPSRDMLGSECGLCSPVVMQRQREQLELQRLGEICGTSSPSELPFNLKTNCAGYGSH